MIRGGDPCWSLPPRATIGAKDFPCLKKLTALLGRPVSITESAWISNLGRMAIGLLLGRPAGWTRLWLGHRPPKGSEGRVPRWNNSSSRASIRTLRGAALRARCKLGADSMKSVLLSKARPRWAKPLVAVTEREIAAIDRYLCHFRFYSLTSFSSNRVEGPGCLRLHSQLAAPPSKSFRPGSLP